MGRFLTVVIPEGPAAELRRLSQARERSTRRHTALANQIQCLMASILPEFLQAMKGVKSASAVSFETLSNAARDRGLRPYRAYQDAEKGQQGEAGSRSRASALRRRRESYYRRLRRSSERRYGNTRAYFPLWKPLSSLPRTWR